MPAPGSPVRVLVPVKAFHQAKLRLAPVLGAGARAALARRMAEAVLAAAAPLPAAVVCDDRVVADWADGAGAEVVWCPGRGLDGAVGDGLAHLARAGAQRVVVAHADLPLATDLGTVADQAPDGGVALVPDRKDDGTNVASVPTGSGFRFAYGAGSFHRHRAEAERLGLPVVVVRDERLAWDVDLPADLDHPEVRPLVEQAS